MIHLLRVGGGTRFYLSAAGDNEMNTIGFALLTISMLSLADSATPKGWRGIVPLHSNRRDVERLLGPGADSCKCAYYTNDINVFFGYSTGDCKSGHGSWDVPIDTVVWITVYPKPNPKLSAVAIEKDKFRKHQGTLKEEFLYENEEEGLTLDVYEDLVQAFIYGPTAKDKRLRCQ